MWGHGRMGTVGRGTACRAPTIMGDPAGRPYDGQPDVMGDARDGRCAPARGGGGWGAACGGTAYRAPPIVGDPSGRPYDGRRDAMGDARDGRRTRWATRTGTRWWGDGWDTVRSVGAWHAVPRPLWATRRVAPTMGNPTRWVTHAMGDAPRRSDAHRDGRMGTLGRGTACRAPTIVGDPVDRPYDGQPDAMGDAPRRPDAETNTRNIPATVICLSYFFRVFRQFVKSRKYLTDFENYSRL
ncbi:MAG: hypothetical protein KatS3mg055_0023 [Chloroflexus sp.]|nr:MAG: hypothetical protein KatS3mg055_0023 [Chloroflexus sp.]